VTLLCAGVSGCTRRSGRKQAYAILACYYGALAMGILYWLVYDLITSYTPKIFYVSDLCWMASYLFLLMLGLRDRRAGGAGLPPPRRVDLPRLSTALTVFYCQWGDWAGKRDLVRSHGRFRLVFHPRLHLGRPAKDTSGRRNFHLAVLILIAWNTACGRRPASGSATRWPTPTSGSTSG
jgi:hypothetical protein